MKTLKTLAVRLGAAGAVYGLSLGVCWAGANVGPGRYPGIVLAVLALLGVLAAGWVALVAVAEACRDLLDRL